MNTRETQRVRETRSTPRRRDRLGGIPVVLARANAISRLAICLLAVVAIAGLMALYGQARAQDVPDTMIRPPSNHADGHRLFMPAILVAGETVGGDTKDTSAKTPASPGTTVLPTPTPTPTPTTDISQASPSATPTHTPLPTDTPPPTVTPTATQVATHTPTATYVPTATPTKPPVSPPIAACDLNAQEQEIASYMISAPNQGRPVLNCHWILVQVARERAEDLGVRDYFDHVNPDGYGPNYLVSEAGFPLPEWYNNSESANYIESIAGGYQDAGTAWQAWMNSEGHRKHLLATDSFYATQVEYGIGYVYVPESSYKHYWVVITAPSP